MHVVGDILSCLEEVLDDTSSSPDELAVHQAASKRNFKDLIVHPNFRLFATMNPSTGRFRGLREKLPENLLSRY